MQNHQLLKKIFVFFLVLFYPFVQFAYSQENPLKRAQRLNQKVIQLSRQGRYSDAVPIAEEVLSIKEQILGRNHPEVRAGMENLVQLYQDSGDFINAQILKSALEMSKKTPVTGSTGSSKTSRAEKEAEYFNTEGMKLSKQGRFSEAIPLFQKALSIKEKVLGPEHPGTAVALNNLADSYSKAGNYKKAESMYNRALGIVKKEFGPENPLVAMALNNMAAHYVSIDEYSKAESLFQKALPISEKALASNDPHTDSVIKSNIAISMNGLAELCRITGRYAKAEPLYKKALSILKNDFDPDYQSIASIINNQGLLYFSAGDYSKSESLLMEAFEIRKKIFGTDNPDVATSMNNLAELYRNMGNFQKAGQFLQEALAIYQKIFGLDHPMTGLCLNNLGLLYLSMGDYANSEQFFLKSQSVYEKTLGLDNPKTALSLNNLGQVYQASGDYAKAEKIFKKALAISEIYSGLDHPDTAKIMGNLANVYYFMGDYAKAEQFIRKVVLMLKKSSGEQHPDISIVLAGLAEILAVQNNFHEAYKYLKQVQQIDEKLIDNIISFTSEKQKIIFLYQKYANLFAFLSFVNQHLTQMPFSGKDALDIWLRRKGIILESQKHFQEALINSDDSKSVQTPFQDLLSRPLSAMALNPDDPDAVQTFQELSRVGSRLSRLAFAGPGKEGTEKYKKNIQELENKKEILQAKLSRLSHAFAVKQNISKADSNKIAKVLPENKVLIEFARTEMFNFKGKESQWNPAHYLAFILHSGSGENVSLIDLGDAQLIDKAISAYKQKIIDIKNIKKTAYTPAAKKLHDLVFAPIKKKLGNIREIFISPDSNLNLIPFEVLMGPGSRFLIEDYSFNYLAAGRDILGFGTAGEKGAKSLLIGDPEFDLADYERKSALNRMGLKDNRQISRQSKEMRGLYFTRLPGTRKEVNAIREILGKDNSDLYTGKSALEDVLIQKQAPKILHLATHGFFLSDIEVELPPVSRGLSIAQPSITKMPPRKIKLQNPFLRSGIALAGANTALKSGDIENSTGIVTAEKIFGLKLRGTEMVVLSACETGLGEVLTGEGVFGLRRAFTQAGAKSLVMSMWSVPDKETQELMTEFYKNIVDETMNRSHALRNAALKQMKTVKQRYGSVNPLYWGAFIFMGEPSTG